MNWTVFTSILSLICILLLASLAYRSRVRHLTEGMNIEFDRLARRRTAETRERCEKLLQGIEGCKTIADNALSTPARAEDLQHALSQIATLLARTLDT